MAILRLAHVGIAVQDLAGGAALWERLGLPQESSEDVHSARTRVSFHPVGETQVELLEGMGEDSPVSRFLAKKGPGVHHLCFAVDDIRAEMARLRGAGFRLLSEEPQPGAHGTLVVFLHPGDTAGVLVELNQESGHP